MTTFTTTIDSPVGPLVLTSDGTALTGVLFDAEVGLDEYATLAAKLGRDLG